MLSVSPGAVIAPDARQELRRPRLPLQLLPDRLRPLLLSPGRGARQELRRPRLPLQLLPYRLRPLLLSPGRGAHHPPPEQKDSTPSSPAEGPALWVFRVGLDRG